MFILCRFFHRRNRTWQFPMKVTGEKIHAPHTFITAPTKQFMASSFLGLRTHSKEYRLSLTFHLMFSVGHSHLKKFVYLQIFLTGEQKPSSKPLQTGLQLYASSNLVSRSFYFFQKSANTEFSAFHKFVHKCGRCRNMVFSIGTRWLIALNSSGMYVKIWCAVAAGFLVRVGLKEVKLWMCLYVLLSSCGLILAPQSSLSRMWLLSFAPIKHLLG